MKMRNRWIARALTVAMTLTAVSTVVNASVIVQQEEVQTEEAVGEDQVLLADFNFDDETNGLKGGLAKAEGTYTLSSEGYDGKSLYLDGTASNYLTVTKEDGTSLLTGMDELTISYDMKADRTATNWAFYAAPTTASNSVGTEKYLGILVNGGTTTVERYNNTGSRPTDPSAETGSDWHHVDVVVSKTDTTIYVNGLEESRVSSSVSLSTLLGSSSILYIGKANWGSGEYFKGWLDNFKIYGKAYSQEELPKSSEAFASAMLEQKAESISDVTLSNNVVTLPDYSGCVTWKSDSSDIVIGENGLTAKVTQPAKGENSVTTSLTAVIALMGYQKEVKVNATIEPAVGEDDPFGYLMVHFVEDSDGYAEKIYLDISRDDNPQQWDPLNGREPILASNLGTTGARDPYITYNPETETYYIIATDLRVFGGDEAGWATWQKKYSTKMDVWESKDLINWTEVHQFDVAQDTQGNTVAQLGMMWAPEATWVPDYYGEGKGAFVVYWSSLVYADDDVNHSTSLGSKIMWGATTDFTQDTWEYGGVFLDGGTAGYIDTTIIQNGNKTYHITKSYAEQIIMEVTEDKEWWKSTNWTRIQSEIGKSRFGSVEGPAVFKNHSQENSWYLFVDDLPTPGYQPMISNDLDQGWDYLDSSDYFLTTNTKHGGVISLTKKQYDAIRNADATSLTKEDLGTVNVDLNATQDQLEEAMPQAEVNTAYNRGTALLFVNWDLSSVNLSEEGTYQVSGVVQTIGANKDQWTGDGGSTSYLAENKVLYSSNEMKVTATVEVSEPAAEPVEKPAQVTGLKASSTVSAVTLSWKKVEDADSYIVYCKNAKGVYTSIGTTKKTSYTDKKKTAATAYSYKVCAVKENGEEQLSGSLSKEVKILTKPKAAAISSLKKQGSNGVLKFKQVAGVTSYEILRYDTKTKKYVPAYKVEGKKIYTYNSSKKKYVKSGTAKVSKKVITATLKKAAKGKYAIRTVVSKKGYGTVTGNTSKAAKLK